MQTLADLVELFSNNIKEYKHTSYKEARVRTDFIDKFFGLLGWDVSNKGGKKEYQRDVVSEDTVVVKGKPRAPDYSFRVNGARKFFVEAKKPFVDIEHSRDPAFQVRRYAYTAKLPLSILTDFEELVVYDTRIKPDHNDDEYGSLKKFLETKERVYPQLSLAIPQLSPILAGYIVAI